MVKSQFLAQIQHMKQQGKKTEILMKVEKWLSSQIDNIYNATDKPKTNLDKRLDEPEYAKHKILIDMIAKAELIAKQRYMRARTSKVGDLKHRSNVNTFEVNQGYIEKSIEKDIDYFNSKSKSWNQIRHSFEKHQ